MRVGSMPMASNPALASLPADAHLPESRLLDGKLNDGALVPVPICELTQCRLADLI
jgi:hypothetical protein